MHRRLLSAAAAGALLLGLAACTDSAEGPVTTPPPSIDIDAPSDGGGEAEPSDEGGESVTSDGGGGEESDAPSAAAPDISPPDPAEYPGMEEQTPEGAEQAFRYYIAVSMWAHQTGETTALAMLESDSCTGCAFLNDDLAKIEQTEKYWSFFTITDAGTAIHESNKYDHEIGYVFSLSSHTRPNESFSERTTVDSIEYLAIGGMDWREGRWITSGMTIEWGDDVYPG